MGKRDYYEVLGVGKNATQDEVREAYKRLAKRYHPDVSKEPDAEARFKEAVEAYNVLSEPEKRRNYDSFGHAAEGFSGFRDAGGFRGFSGSSGFGSFDFDDLFSGMNFGFGNVFREDFSGERKGRRRRGSGIRHDATVSFEDAAFGTELEINVERLERCGKCRGAGGRGLKKCESCGGSGMKQHSARTPFGVFMTASACGACSGSGETFSEKCGECNGKGLRKAKRKIRVKVPRGIESGQYLRLQGEGNAAASGEAGDLFVVVFVEPHAVFRRDGLDVFSEAPIGFAEAALGAEIGVQTLRGSARLKVPAGTQTGTVFRMRGCGIAAREREKGDHYVKVKVETPTRISKAMRAALERLAEEEKPRED